MNKYIQLNSDEYSNLSIDEKIKVLNNNIEILNNNFDKNNILLQETKAKYSENKDINVNEKILIFKEFEKSCREANTSLNNSIEKNQNELEKQKNLKIFLEKKIDFDIFIKDF